MLSLPHVVQRREAERVLGEDQERNPERLVLFAENEQFDAELRAAVREKWIAAWLYLRHLTEADEGVPDQVTAEFILVSRLTEHALGSSRQDRHVRIRKEIREVLRVERARSRARRAGGDRG